MGTVPLLAGAASDGTVAIREAEGYGLAIDFHEDILPIFERRCTHCHGGDEPDAGLALDRPGIDSASRSTWYCLVRDRHQSCVPEALRHRTGAGSGRVTFRRPQLTRYLRAFNSLASPLYWKAAGHRTDGRTDDTIGDDAPVAERDIDFGPAHPTEITPDELGLLSRWIDIGAPGGPMESRDTQRPTLHLAATVDGSAVVALHVGTVDLGSGIDVGSLELCLLDGDGECARDLSTEAAPHGVVRIPLDAPLTDPDIEVRALIRDLAGNETEVQRTVAWLLRAPPPPPASGRPGADGGLVVADGGAAGEEGELSGGCGCRAVGGGDARGAGLLLTLGLILVARRRRPRRARGGSEAER